MPPVQIKLEQSQEESLKTRNKTPPSLKITSRASKNHPQGRKVDDESEKVDTELRKVAVESIKDAAPLSLKSRRRVREVAAVSRMIVKII